MKKQHSLLLFIILMTAAQAQNFNGDFLDINNVKAKINSAGDLFWDFNSAQFTVPKNGTANTIFAGNLWIGGIDGGGQLHVAGQTYRQTGTDIFQGPVMNPSSYSSGQDALWNRVWKINRTTVDSFRLGLYSVTPQIILDWPGNGNTSLGQAPILAPFYDGNNNGIYEPSLGDYPSMRGDQEVFFIYNDDRNSHTETGGQKMGVEIHGAAYAFKCSADSALYHTVFFHYDIFNRSQNNYDSVRVGSWNDFDLGDPMDDLIGCDSTLQTFYIYNGDNQDGTGGPGSYGQSPPAQGVTFLNYPMTSFMYYNNDWSVTGNPSEASDYYGYMHSTWKDSTVVTFGGNGYGGVTPANFMYSGNPVSATGWNDPNGPADRRGIGATTIGLLGAGQMKSVDEAYVFGRNYSGSNLTSITNMKQRIQTIRGYYASGTTPCGSFSPTAVNETATNPGQMFVYPSPATEDLFIRFSSPVKVDYTIYDAMGQVVARGRISGANSVVPVGSLAGGIYILTVSDGERVFSKKFVKN